MMTELRLWNSRLYDLALRGGCAFLLCGSSHTLAAEKLRLSKVSEVETQGTERLVLSKDSDKKEIFVEKEAIVTEADIDSASLSPVNEVNFTFSETGAKKLADATKVGHGVMRIAILVNGELISAPVVMAQLGRNISVNGLDHIEDLDVFCWKIQGKSDEEIVALLREAERKAMEEPVVEKKKPTYHSDEEYAALKKEREKIGIFYVDEIPDEDRLDQRLEKGMSEEDVIREFGRPGSRSTDREGMLRDFSYELAPEKGPVEKENHVSSFRVSFENGRVSGWMHSGYTYGAREPKQEGEVPTHLNMRLPDFDMGDERFGMIRWIEELQVALKEGELRPHPYDYVELILMINSIWTGKDENAVIKANCSVVRLLADHPPEVGALKRPGEDTIDLLQLRDALKPYLSGEKPFPDDAEPGK